MVEYIDKKAACKAMPDDYYGWRDKQTLRSIPAADVRENVIRTQGDKLRAMSDEELAEFFLDYVACADCPVGDAQCKREFARCKIAALGWLRQEVDDGDTH